MKKPEKQTKVDNPLVFSNEKTEVLHEAFSRFSEVMDEYLEQHPESQQEIASLKAALRACWDFSNRSANYTFSLILRPENPHLAKAKLRFSCLV